MCRSSRMTSQKQANKQISNNKNEWHAQSPGIETSLVCLKDERGPNWLELLAGHKENGTR